MKVICKKEFIDKHTQELHLIGQVFEVSQERFKEIDNKGLVEVVKEKQQVGTPAEDAPVRKRTRKKVVE